MIETVTERMPRWGMLDEVPVAGWFGTKTATVIGLRQKVKQEDEWDEIEEINRVVVTPGEWEYLTAFRAKDGYFEEWGWVKQSEIEKELARVND